MAKETDLVLALDFITQGAEAIAALPKKLMQEAFALESFQAETDKIHAKARDWTLGRSIQGLGIGSKITKGTETGDLAMRVYVTKKKARAKVENPVPKKVTVPEVGEITTDVVEIGVVDTETFSERVRPAMPGSGLGHRDVTVGTFGCLVRRPGESGLYILSNSHVLANSGLATIGDKVVQPGDADGGGVRSDTLATLAGFVPFDFADGYPNLVDAAIARVRSSRSVAPEIRILGVQPAGVNTALERGMTVKKVGRTTDFTTGVVQDLHYRLRLPYRISRKDPKLRKSAGLRELVLTSRYTAGGDSGSLVLDDQNRAVGLHFAGSVAASIFCRIQNVFDALKIELA